MSKMPKLRRHIGEWYVDVPGVGPQIPVGWLRCIQHPGKLGWYIDEVREKPPAGPGQEWLDWIERLRETMHIVIVEGDETDRVSPGGIPITECKKGYHSVANGRRDGITLSSGMRLKIFGVQFADGRRDHRRAWCGTTF
jgi:hypothetical protein